tara:strand:+ start:38 stop:763 length:726 start_codon:yes stop_codon:yes gene_type:complete
MSGKKKNNNSFSGESLTEDTISAIREGLGLKPKKRIDEAFVVQSRKFNLPTELLSQKTKVAHEELLDGYVETLNEVSAKLDTVDRETANSNDSDYRSLKIDETYNCNAAFLHGLYFENISDLHSKVTMDSLSYIRLERDFGTFDAWQKDFIACCMSSRNGWAITVYNAFLDRYMNVVVDLHSLNVPINCYPVIVMDMWEHAYYKDYLTDKKSYVFGMMKQFNWPTIEERFKKSEKIAKAMK